jgi:predicted DNA-binding transcriptional regulator AlpA
MTSHPQGAERRATLSAPTPTYAEVSAPRLRQMIDLQELCEATGRSETGLYDLMKAGKGPPFYKIGKRRMFDVAEVNEWIESHKVTP